jgi:hypothetical protein
MAEGETSKPLREWLTAWTTDEAQARIQWQSPPPTPKRRARTYSNDDNTSASLPKATDVLYEHDLDRDGKEYYLFSHWAKGSFPPLHTDRGGFAAKLQEEVQEPGSEITLDKIATLLKACMEFGDDGRLAARVLYQPKCMSGE